MLRWGRVRPPFSPRAIATLTVRGSNQASQTSPPDAGAGAAAIVVLPGVIVIAGPSLVAARIAVSRAAGSLPVIVVRPLIHIWGVAT